MLGGGSGTLALHIEKVNLFSFGDAVESGRHPDIGGLADDSRVDSGWLDGSGAARSAVASMVLHCCRYALCVALPGSCRALASSHERQTLTA